MAYFTNNDSVIDAFLNCKPANAGRLKTDGQSLFSYDLRIAEHIPDDNGGATTIVYDYTRGGNAYRSQTTSSHVGLIKRRLPRRNVMLIETAKAAGLIEG
tara:strand:- start:405 stop:704 length:300 start_codon:yes stop_codon:yes gene_type:complete